MYARISHHLMMKQLILSLGEVWHTLVCLQIIVLHLHAQFGCKTIH